VSIRYSLCVSQGIDRLTRYMLAALAPRPIGRARGTNALASRLLAPSS
jgi:hypothetical protein